jgi:mono/diheme cytochrome c family protein
MSLFRRASLALCLIAMAAGCDKAPEPAQAGAAKAILQGPGLGQAISPAELTAIDITIDPDGSNLPEGGGTVAEGLVVYQQHCASCHGPEGKGEVSNAPVLVGGVRSLATPKPIKTVTSFWNSAPKVFDYIRRTMPPLAPQSLTNDQVYAVTAYLLSRDGVISGDAEIDAKRLSAVQMPNRDGYFPVEEFAAGAKGPKG